MKIYLIKTSLAIILTVIIFNANAQSDEEAVKKVLRDYQKAVERLDATGTENLFTSDSQIFESGGVEGTYTHYLEHHLGPELKVFKSFQFSDYEVKVQIDEPYAFTTETYIYTIVLNEDDRTIIKKGVATAILKKNNGNWQIMKSHSSSRNKK